MKLQNNLLENTSQGRMCTAVGAKIVTSHELVYMAKSAGYDSIFIEMEHSTISIHEASRLCSTALLVEITPIVRVPPQCGDGFVQQLLDGGAMGIVFPHINTAGQTEDAERAVQSVKFPPRGHRSLTAALPHFHFHPVSPKQVVSQLDAIGSTVIAMVESVECLANIDAIAAVPGVDVLLLGANDLSLELGILGEWHNPRFQNALVDVSRAARSAGKIFGIAGLYTRPDICRHAVQNLGARFVVGHLDVGLLAMAMHMNVQQLRDMDS